MYSRSVDVNQDGKVVSSKKTGGIKVRVNPSFRSHLMSDSNENSPIEESSKSNDNSNSQTEENAEPASENLIDL